MPDDTMIAETTARRNPTPIEEWVVVYRCGLPAFRIAELAGVSVSTVSYHLRLAHPAEPGR